MVYTAIDCQGFAGGFTLGVVQAGFELVGKREMKGGFGVANCEANRHLLGYNWQSEAVDPVDWSPRSANLVFGNPPCSGFSVLSSKEFRGADSKINACMWAFVEFAARCAPEVAVFESVQLAYSQGRDLMSALRADLEARTGLSYDLYHVLHNAYSIGGPAQRRRYFWVASRVPFGIERPILDRVPLFRDVVGDLINQPESWEAHPYMSDPTWYSARLRSTRQVTTCPMVDGHMSIDNPNTRRTRELLSVAEWNHNEHTQTVTRRYFDRHGGLPPLWQHKEDQLKGRDFFMGYNTPTMWNPDHPARVITGAGLLNGVHWATPRTFTHREAARILGFPDDWLIYPIRNTPGLFMTWGKGITVHCGRWIATWISRALDGEPGTYTGDPDGDREWKIDVTNDWRQVYANVPSTRFTIRSSIVTETVEAPQVEFVAPDAAPTTDVDAPIAEARRGRPRPSDTKERDAAVFTLIGAEPLTTDAIAEKLGVEKRLAYLSLYRLRRDGAAQRSRGVGGVHIWSAAAGPVPPTE